MGNINIVASESVEDYKINIIEVTPPSDLQDLSTTLAIKDLNSISDRAYNRMRIDLNLKKRLPQLNKIIRHRTGLKSIQEVPENEFGVYISVKKKLEFIIQNMHLNNKLDNIANNTITIKLCGDGARISKTLNIYNLTMSIIEDKNICKTSKGHYIIGIFSIDENYEEISRALAPIVNEINTLDTIKITHDSTDYIYKIDIKIAADLKAIAQLLGLANATAHFPCPYCKIHFSATKVQSFEPVRAFINQLENDWDLGSHNTGEFVGEDLYYRTITEAKRLINKNKADEKKGKHYSKFRIFHKKKT